ncbi:MAG: c-type cytochrome [Candidatus Tectomicrobia bacterium]|uniref:C-type cytochrome n=1 Tax=Tectimicrobiota bacterium TaxID=2528274 RepID=A0A933LPR0_UNCTE|nr:c-type cytochrome [Candidatus Tectomicrobia bacterium]
MAKVEDKSYRVHFWVIGLLLVLSTIWAVWDEVEIRRPWKSYQRQFNQMAYARVKADFDAAEAELVRKLSQTKPLGTQVKNLQELENQINNRMKTLQNNPAYQTALKKLQGLERSIREAQQDIQFAKSEAEEYFYRWKRALHSGQAYHKYQELWNQAKTFTDQLLPRQEALQKEAKAVKGQLKAQEADLEKLKKIKEEILDYHHALSERLSNVKKRPLEIKQVILPAFEKNRFGDPIARVDRCTTCHLGIDREDDEKVPQPFTSHPQKEVFLIIHKTEKMGCTPCHRGQGNALRSAFQAHGVTYDGKNGHNQGVGSRKYLEHWEEPIYEGDFIQSSCATCHQTFDIKGAEVRNKGRLLFSELGCHGCHLTVGYEEKDKIGPDLKRIKFKVNPGWLVEWIKDPKQYLPKTRMPHYRFSDEQVLAITAYLVKNFEEYDPPGGYQTGGSVENGKELVENVGCLGCHSIGEHEAGGYLAPVGYDLVPNLSLVAKKVTGEWLFYWLKNPKKFRPTTRMPNLRLSDNEARDITAYLLTLGNPVKDDLLMVKMNEESLERNGSKLIFDYGCYSCHEIKGFEAATRIAPPLSDFGNKDHHIDLYFGDAPIRDNFRLEFGREVETWENWTFNKLKDPRIYMDEITESKMPDFGLSDENAKALMVLLKSFTGRLAPEEYRRVLTETEKRIEKGQNLVRSLNCLGCHVIYEKGGDIRKFYEDSALAPPVLTGEGEKVQAGWLFRFLKKPVALRNWFKVRMPTFDLSDENASDLVDFFKAYSPKRNAFFFLDQEKVSAESYQDGKRLFGIPGTTGYDQSLKCDSCHPRGEEKPEGRPSDWGPDLALSKNRLEPDWIVKWLKDPQSVQEGTRMPNFFYTYDYYEGKVEVTELLESPEEKIQALLDYLMVMKE